jgi:signal transduction histidine kinase
VTARGLPRILCVDDEPNVLAGLSSVLRKRFDVTTAVGGEAGLQALSTRGPFLVIISDFAMPEMDGAQFLAQARIVAPDTVRVLLTGEASMANAIEVVNSGHVFRFLTKPCPPHQLIAALEECLQQARLVTADRELVDRKLQAMAASLLRAERLASLGTMTGAVCHEINNVLMVFTSALETIREDFAAGQLPAVEDLDALDRVRDHLATYATNLRNLGRQRKTEEAPVADLGATAQRVIAMLQSAGLLRRARVSLQVPNGEVGVAIHRTELEQILVNIIKNAIEAMEGRTQPMLAITICESGRCTIADNGTGIASNDLQQIFDPYFTTKAEDKGTGLGLFVVRQILQQRGGDITVASEPGRGTEFTLSFRLAVAVCKSVESVAQLADAS